MPGSARAALPTPPRLRRRRTAALAIVVVLVLGTATASVALVFRDSSSAAPVPHRAIVQPVKPPGLPGKITKDGGLEVSSDDYGDGWPLSVEGGVLRCEHGAVTFHASDHVYALNPDAQSRQLGGPLAPVWAPNPKIEGARMSTALLIEHGLALC